MQKVRFAMGYASALLSMAIASNATACSDTMRPHSADASEVAVGTPTPAAQPTLTPAQATPTAIPPSTAVTPVVTNSPPATISGPWEITSALALLYPSATSHEPETVDVPVVDHIGSYTDTLRVIFSAPYAEGGLQKQVLILAGTTWEGGTHSSRARISAAVFDNANNSWSLETRNDSLDWLGEFGTAPTDIKLVQIGPQEYGFMILDRFSTLGDVTTALYLYATVDGRIGRILHIEDVAWKRLDIDSPVYRELQGYESIFIFVPGGDSQYFDFKIETSGVRFDKGVGFVPVHDKSVYKFNGLEYVLP